MHARIATYQLTGGTAAEVASIAQEGMLPIFRSSRGFEHYGIVDPGDGTVVSLSVWATRADADRAVTQAAAFVRERLADKITLQSNVVGDLAFYEGAMAAV